MYVYDESSRQCWAHWQWSQNKWTTQAVECTLTRCLAYMFCTAIGFNTDTNTHTYYESYTIFAILPSTQQWIRQQFSFVRQHKNTRNCRKSKIKLQISRNGFVCVVTALVRTRRAYQVKKIFTSIEFCAFGFSVSWSSIAVAFQRIRCMHVCVIHHIHYTPCSLRQKQKPASYENWTVDSSTWAMSTHYSPKHCELWRSPYVTVFFSRNSDFKIYPNCMGSVENFHFQDQFYFSHFFDYLQELLCFRSCLTLTCNIPGIMISMNLSKNNSYFGTFDNYTLNICY